MVESENKGDKDIKFTKKAIYIRINSQLLISSVKQILNSSIVHIFTLHLSILSRTVRWPQIPRGLLKRELVSGSP